MASSAAAAAADHTVSPILPRRTRQRRQSTVDGEEAELGALDLASELPAVWSQRAELDKQPVNKEDHHQVGSRVSCAARCFDSKQGLAKWSRVCLRLSVRAHMLTTCTSCSQAAVVLPSLDRLYVWRGDA